MKKQVTRRIRRVTCFKHVSLRDSEPYQLCRRKLSPVPVTETSIQPSGTVGLLDAGGFATLKWVEWFHKRRRPEQIGNTPPAEAKAHDYAEFETFPITAWLTKTGFQQTRSDSVYIRPNDRITVVRSSIKLTAR